MFTDNNIQDKFSRAKIVKKQIVNVMSSLKEMGNVLPEKPDSRFESALQTLTTQKCVISICGEASRGKSHFLNALIGKDILPVNEHSTTSQACKVTYAENESYALVFEDETRTPIDASEVAKYCSALESTIGDERINGKTLKYIEVNTPGKYLIPGVSFYDTPGLGSLHFSHAEVTLKCLNESNAVLFFCSIDHPITQDELSFISKIYKKTDNVLFIQSRSDSFDSEVQEKIADRNKEILSESSVNELIKTRYRRTADFKFFPLSSKLLRESASNPNKMVSERQYMRSHFDIIKRVIEELVFRTVDYSSSVIAYNTICSYQSGVVSTLKNENEQLSTNSFEERKKFENIVKERKEQFDNEFGKNSNRQARLKEDLEKAFNDIRSQANSFFGKQGELHNDVISQLDYFPNDIYEIKEYEDYLISQIDQAVNDGWYETVKSAQQTIFGICADFQLDMDEDSFQNNRFSSAPQIPLRFNYNAVDRSIAAIKQREKDIANAKIRNTLLTVAKVGVWIADAAIMISTQGGSKIATPGVAAGVCGFLDGFKVPVPDQLAPTEENIERFREDFRKQIEKNFDSISKTIVGFIGHQGGEIGRLIVNLKTNAMNLINEDVKSRKDRFDDELDRLRKNLNLSDKQAKDQININNDLLQKLEDIQNRLEECRNELDDLKSAYDSI